ncbi:hypothetical protein CDEST_10962 [Colletotrichum destructivum]|uniref:Uncharacterized protein n=1 Tax=Colletotrichum destructivum TaxID=34406 RepID=A0AAX4IRV7_9PEZI|nr:hypothetical protein CDEST_10962 [Colletotrichum destructivum]
MRVSILAAALVATPILGYPLTSDLATRDDSKLSAFDNVKRLLTGSGSPGVLSFILRRDYGYGGGGGGGGTSGPSGGKPSGSGGGGPSGPGGGYSPAPGGGSPSGPGGGSPSGPGGGAPSGGGGGGYY